MRLPNFTIASRLARPATSADGPDHSRRRVIHMYREWYRSAPEIVSMYGLDIPPSDIRHAIRQKFEESRHISDVRIVDKWLHKERQMFQEVMNGWAQTPHIKGILLETRRAPQLPFLQRFYRGRDEDQVLTAPSDLQ